MIDRMPVIDNFSHPPITSRWVYPLQLLSLQHYPNKSKWLRLINATVYQYHCDCVDVEFLHLLLHALED